MANKAMNDAKIISKLKLLNNICLYALGVCGIILFLLKVAFCSFIVLFLVFAAMSIYVSISYYKLPSEQKKGLFSLHKHHPYYLSIGYSAVSIVLLVIWIKSLSS